MRALRMLPSFLNLAFEHRCFCPLHIELLPEIRRCATLSFHKQPAEAVAARSPLVAMLLKYAKEANGEYKCPLVTAAAELSRSSKAHSTARWARVAALP